MILQQPFAISISTFIPTQIAGLKLWLDATQMGLSDGTAVTTWTDLSTAGNNFTQSTAGNKPVFHTNIINSLPAVQFDGTDDFMSSAANPVAVPLSAFVVTQPTLNTASQKSYATIIHAVTTSVGLFMAARLTTNFWGTFVTTSGDLSSTNALTSGTNYLLENTVASVGAIPFLYQRGVQVATSANSEIGPANGGGGLGKDLINANRQYAGYIAEVLIYDTVLSSGDRATVENYLIAKWAL